MFFGVRFKEGFLLRMLPRLEAQSMKVALYSPNESGR